MNREVDEQVVACPQWIDETMQAIRQVGTRDRPIKPDAILIAYWLLCVIEVDDLKIPQVAAFGQGGLEIDWEIGTKALTFAIHAKLGIGQRRTKNRKTYLTSTSHDQTKTRVVEWIREGIDWLFPNCYEYQETS